MIEFKKKPNEKGTGIFYGKFRDSLGFLVTPTTAEYSVFDENGLPINGLDHLEITGFTSSWEVVLTGDQLIVPAAGNKVFFTVFITYDSSKGNGLEGTEQGRFFINDLIGV